MFVDIPGALRALARIVDRMEELIEWQRLIQQERHRPFSTSFDLNHHLAEEMEDFQACFANADHDLRELLKRTDLHATQEQRQRWVNELEQLEEQAASVSTAAKFLNS